MNPNRLQKMADALLEGLVSEEQVDEIFQAIIKLLEEFQKKTDITLEDQAQAITDFGNQIKVIAENTTEDIKKQQETVDSVLSLVKQLQQEINNIVVEDGEDADEEAVIERVLDYVEERLDEIRASIPAIKDKTKEELLAVIGEIPLENIAGLGDRLVELNTDMHKLGNELVNKVPRIEVFSNGSKIGSVHRLNFTSGATLNNGVVDVSGGSSITFKEGDNNPSVAADTVIFPNGTLTDNGDGSVTFDPGSLGGGDMNTATYDPATKSEQVLTVSDISDTAYDATSWNGVTTIAPSKNAVRDKIEALDAAKANTSHTHTASEVTDFDTEVSNNTDVAANTAARHSAVSLAGTPDYITISGQTITRNQIDLTTDVTGDLPFTNIAQIATNRILGRSTAGTGDIEALADADARTIMGLSTSDSPQFAGINVGHATDTTITRVSAGVIAVEGTNVSLQGHTHSLSAITDVTATATELNVLDGIPATLTATELGYVDGVTSAIQTQIDAKAPTASPSFTGTVTLPTGLTGVIRADSGVVSVDTDVTDIVSAASDSAAGKVELATAAETTTGTDATRAVTPDGLAGSEFGKRSVSVLVSGSASGDSALATGDGLAAFPIDTTLNGMNLVAIKAYVTTVSSSGAPLFQVRRSRRTNATTRSTVDMLTTGVSIDANEFESADATTAAVINTSNDDVQTGDILLIDCDTAGTGTKGAQVLLTFQLP